MSATTSQPGTQGQAQTPLVSPGMGPQPTAPSRFQPAGASSAAAGASKNTQDTILVTLTRDQETQLITYATGAQQSLMAQYSMRSEMENIDREYMREKDWTEHQVKSRIANRIGDSTKFQNVTVPIIMPQVQSALSYLLNVFCTGYPMFPVTADPTNEDAAMAMETIIQENATTTGWAQELAMFFRDGLKYNLHAIEVEWQQRTNWSVKSDATKPGAAAAEKVLWNGNVLKRMDLYNTFWDPRVHPSKMHCDGEFAGYTEVYSRSRFKKFCNDLYNKVPVSQVTRALNSQMVQGAIGASSMAAFGYYIPIINPYPFYNRQSGFDWMAWMTNTIGSKNGATLSNAYSVTKMYARIIPSDFGIQVPAPNTPQVWKFVIVNGQVILSAERLTNIHSMLPILFGQPIEDGLDYQTKSFATNVQDMQSVATAMMNGYIASKRRLVGDRVLYDPSRIKESDINSSNPAAKIPVRPSAMGKTVSDAVYQFPFRDEQVDSLLQGSSLVINYANLINGQNPAQQGQFVKGNKTRHEYDDVMGHGNGQNQMLAMATESQVFTPMKEMIKLNILQYQEAKAVYNAGKKTTVDVDPVALRQAAVHFKVSDGLIPSDKITGDDLLQTVVQQLAVPNNPIGPGYNLTPMFTYLMKTSGLDLSPFEKSPEQQQYEQQMNQWQAAAQEAAKNKTAFNTPQPQPSPQLQAQMQAKAPSGAGPSATTPALESTQGAT